MVLSPARAAASGGSVAGSTTRKLVVRKLRKLLGVLAMMAVAGIGIWSLSDRQRLAPAAKPDARDTRQMANSFVLSDQQWASLTTQKVEEQTFRSELVTDGKIAIDEDRATPVFSPYSGIIKRLAVKPGDPIDSGQLLFTIEATDMVQAENDFIVALDGVNTALSQLKMAQVTEQRQHALFDAKATAQKDWQQAQTDLVVAENTRRSAEIGLEAVRNRLRILKKTEAEIAEFEKTGKINPETPIFAPIAGTIVQRKVGPGQYITSGTSDPSGDPVFVIGDLSTVWLVANVREADAMEIKRGQTVAFKVLSARDRQFTAKINYVAEIIDAGSRRLQVRATVDNADKALKPEMFARVTVFTSDGQSSVAVPREAVIYEGDTARVWVVGEGRSLELRKITTGLVSGNLVQVLTGIGPQDRVVTKGTLFIDRAAGGGDAG